MRSNPHLPLECLRWCAKYGVESNKETIWRRVKAEEARVAALRKKIEFESSVGSSSSSTQLTLDLRPVSQWQRPSWKKEGA